MTEQRKSYAEIMQLVNDTADRAASKAAESVKTEIQLEMALQEKRLSDSLHKMIVQKLDEHLGGMPPHEHYSQHQRISAFLEAVGTLRMSFFTKLVSIAAVFTAGAVAMKLMG